MPRVSKAAKALAAQGIENGQHLFLYCNGRTNQVVYSLTRTLRLNAVQKQLPFLGSHSVPSKIRKDVWRPFATVYFPSGQQGLWAYKRLREFRERHEHEWELPEYKRRERRAAHIMDQKANSVADLARVLEYEEQLALKGANRIQRRDDRHEAAHKWVASRLQELKDAKSRASKIKDPDEAAKVYGKTMKREKIKLQKALQMSLESRAVESIWDRHCMGRWPSEGSEPMVLLRAREQPHKTPFTMEGVKIEWANVLDAEFAETWPASVIHDQMAPPTYRNRNLPTSKVRRDTDVDEVPDDVVPEERVESSASGQGFSRYFRRGANAPRSPAPGPTANQLPSNATFLQRLNFRLKYGRPT